MKIKLNKSKRGISLIVLVITIIVMIIIATAIILSINSNNIVGRANEAKMSSERANIIESATVEYAKYDLKTKTGKLDSSEISAEEYVKDALKKQGVSQDTLKLLMVTQEGNIFFAKIPNGFVASDISTEDEISEGLVIYEGNEKVSTDSDAQTTRNQYVWVPVPDISKFVRRDGYEKGEPQTYVSNGETSEPFSKGSVTETNDSTGEYAEYAKMRASVEKYGGFYIARYEAGTTSKRTNSSGNIIVEGTSFKEDGITPDVLSQKGKYVYNAVGWSEGMEGINNNGNYFKGDGAVKLSRSVYPEISNKDVVSTLIYGVQWDAVMDFMKYVENPDTEGKKYIEDSTGMGLYIYMTGSDYNFITGEDVDNSKSNMVKNIYDMAGNVCEWTMEAFENTKRVNRGGYVWNLGVDAPASVRGASTPASASYAIGFRIALYLK